MAGGIINVSTSRPCPICGKPDWCGILPLADGGVQHLCMRNVDNMDIVSFVDGCTYLYVTTTKRGNAIYEEKYQRQTRVENFKRVNVTPSPATYKPVELVYENVVAPLPNEKLDAIYRDLLSLLVLEDKHRKYLEGEGWSRDLTIRNNIKSFPEDDAFRFKNKGIYFSRNLWRKSLAAKLVEKYKDLTGVPGAYKNANGEWTFAGLGGILFPLYDAKGHIYRLRVRVDRQYFNSQKEDISIEDFELLKKQNKSCYKVGKYLNFSSYKEDPEKRKEGIISNLRDCGCEASSNLGFYMNSKTDDMYVWYVTEGEKKSIIGNSVLKVPFVDIPGVNSYSKLVDYDDNGMRPIDYMKEYGAQLIVVAFDADKATNEKVLDSEKKTIEVLLAEGFSIAVANWDSSIGKGIDDLLVRGGKPYYEFA